jgi:cytochrome c553
VKHSPWLMMVVSALTAVAQTPAAAPVPAKKELKPESVAPAEAAASANLPAWLFPIDPASIKPPATPPKLDDAELLSIPDSTEKFTAARIGDLHNPPDWFPAEHGPMPDIVAKGRAPKVTACAFCHTPTGQGRPENSALAGLPEKYIREQLEDFKSGKRLPSGPESYKPSRGMHAIAVELTDEEIDESAKYFSQFKLARRSWIIESLRIPRAEPKDWSTRKCRAPRISRIACSRWRRTSRGTRSATRSCNTTSTFRRAAPIAAS